MIWFTGALMLAITGASGDCGTCHRAETANFAKSGMQQALESGSDDRILRSNPRLSTAIDGYSYQIIREGGQSFYSVTDGKKTIRALIEWGFGQGSAGQTYLFQRDGRWFESRVSYYSALSGLDLTTGAKNIDVPNLDEAVGRSMGAADAAQCFGCHATRVVKTDPFSPAGLTAGVQCERCHGAAAQHVQAVRAGDKERARMRKLGDLTTEELSDFCGECHRTWSQIASSGPQGILNVRFQPYRLTNSKCYDSSDVRIKCTACHNPHEDVQVSPAAYDAKCSQCHAAGAAPVGKKSARVCPVATQNCVTCHMPKIELPGTHKKFTDHTIRVVQSKESYPG